MRYLAIAPTRQRQGIGKALIEQLQERARLVMLPIRLRVLRGNPASGLYERVGFEHDSDENQPSRPMHWPPGV